MWKREINSASFRRAMLIKTEWVAEVVEEWRSAYPTGLRAQSAIVRAFEKTGCAVTVDGTGWEVIKPERVTCAAFVIARNLLD